MFSVCKLEPCKNRGAEDLTMNLLLNGFKFVEGIDPSPFFVLSLFPYLFFLYWAQKSTSIPRISLLGFRLTLLFVFMTIVFAILASHFYGKDLTDVDPMHGSAEAFLTLSDALVALGFLRIWQAKRMEES